LAGVLALVFDPSQPPTGSNVNMPKLAVLAAPYPQVVAGTPTSWSFKSGTFQLSYSPQRADGQGSFSPGA
jgi:endoglycosylceramidase